MPPKAPVHKQPAKAESKDEPIRTVKNTAVHPGKLLAKAQKAWDRNHEAQRKGDPRPEKVATRTYLVTSQQTGRKLRVENCLDESDAKRCFYAAFGVDRPADERVKVELDTAPPVEADPVDVSPEDDESPVDEISATEAIDQVSRMRSTDKLQHIVDHDDRTTVVEAARRRLAELG